MTDLAENPVQALRRRLVELIETFGMGGEEDRPSPRLLVPACPRWIDEAGRIDGDLLARLEAFEFDSRDGFDLLAEMFDEDTLDPTVSIEDHIKHLLAEMERREDIQFEHQSHGPMFQKPETPRQAMTALGATRLMLWCKSCSRVHELALADMPPFEPFASTLDGANCPQCGSGYLDAGLDRVWGGKPMPLWFDVGRDCQNTLI